MYDMKWKIICKDNYDREIRAEHLIANFHSKELAKVAASAINVGQGHFTDNYYVVVPKEYILWRGMADLIGEPEQFTDPAWA